MMFLIAGQGQGAQPFVWVQGRSVLRGSRARPRPVEMMGTVISYWVFPADKENGSDQPTGQGIHIFQGKEERTENETD